MQSTVCDTSPAVQKLLKQLPSLRQELYSLLVALKKNEDWRSLRQDFYNFDPTDSTPYIFLTVGCTFDFAEGYITWSNCNDIAKDLIEEIEGRIHELQSIQGL